MNLNHLAIFQAVAACNSVSGGARQLHISQSAVSKQLGEFEVQIGTPLFQRMPRGMRLTEAGRLLLGYANRLFAIEAEAEAAIGDLRQLAGGRITVGASRAIGDYLLPPILAAFHRRHPAVELSLQVENTQSIEAKLVAGEIDIGFAEGIAGGERLDYQVFAQDQLVLIAATAHPIAHTAPLSLAALADHPLLMHEIGSGTRAFTEKALAEAGIHPRPAMTLASTEAIKHTVASGVGMAFLSALAVREELRAGKLVLVPIEGLDIRRPLHRVQLRNTRPGPALEAFLRVLAEAR